MDISQNPVLSWKMIKMNIEKANPRRIALDMLGHYFKTGASLKELISEGLEGSGACSLDRRFIFNIVKGTVRYVLRSDFIISNLSKRRTADIDSGILNILRMGIYQVHFMDRVPAYSIVDESVKLAKNVNRAAAGFVNAVMRRASEIADPDEYLIAMLQKQKAGDEKRLSVIHSFPEWIIKYWMEYYGKERTARICAHLNRIPEFYIRINMDRHIEQAGADNSGECTYAGILDRLKNIKAKPVGLASGDMDSLNADFRKVFEPAVLKHIKNGEPVFKEAALISSAMGLEKEKLYKNGIISVQDISSQMAIKYFLGPGPEEKILDCCAAPGGKASFTAQLMKNSGYILAVDKSPEKIKILSENLKRHGSKNVDTFLSDSSRTGFLDRMEGDHLNYFDAVIVDAPCSALGTTAKNPEAKYNREFKDIERLSDMALDIMAACDPYLKNGGRMLFYTCTISPVENGQMIRRFLSLMNGRYTVAENIDNAGDPVKMEMDIMPYYLESEAGYFCVLNKKGR